MNIVARTAAVRFIAWCKTCAERRRQRHYLATLNDHALRDIALDEHMRRDIGTTRAQAWLEAEKKRFWRL
jgi:uncharacterized protein YjiS (DUF1127 family)